MAEKKTRRNLKRWLATLAGAALLAGSLLAPFGGAVHADGDGYLDHWNGHIDVKYAHLNFFNGGYDVRGLPVSPPLLSDTIDQSWAQHHDYVCGIINAEVQSGEGFEAWRSCDLPHSGELRAKMLDKNKLGLRYVVPGVHASFDSTKFTNPTIDATFDIELDLSLVAAPTIDGDFSASSPDYRNLPLQVQDGLVHIRNLQVSSGSPIANLWEIFTKDMQHAEEAFNNATVPLGGDVFAGAIGDANTQLHDGAAQLGYLVAHGSPDYASVYNWFSAFNFDVNLDPGNHHLVLTFRRDVDPPPAPTNVHTNGNVVNWSWGDAGGSGPGGLRLNIDNVLYRDSSFHFEVYANKPTNLGEQSVLIGTSQSNSFTDRTTDASFGYRVCAVNLSGRNCGGMPGAGGGGAFGGNGTQNGNTGNGNQHPGPAKQ